MRCARTAFIPVLSPAANYLLGGVYILLSLISIFYIGYEFEEIGTVRAGFYNTTDMVIGSLMFVLVMEYTRKQHFELFVVNIILIFYAVYGWIVPGMFGHPGLEWNRVLSSMSVEMATGVFSRLPQLALTLIGSFLLVLSVLSAFGCVDSIVNTAKRLANKSAHALPQAAVLGSMGVATVSGSGAANAITIGSATIPAMIASGIPRVHAAAIECSASLGGQLMPPVMGVAAFLMAEFLGKSYFDVVARGYAPALDLLSWGQRRGVPDLRPLPDHHGGSRGCKDGGKGQDQPCHLCGSHRRADIFDGDQPGRTDAGRS